MPQRTRGRLVTAIYRGRTGRRDGAWAAPLRWADPEVDPDRRHRCAAGGAAAAAACAATDGAAAAGCRSAGSSAPPPLGRSPLAASGVRSAPLAPPTRSHPLAANPAAPQPTVIPQGTPAGQNPLPFTGYAAVPAAFVNPSNGSMVGRRQADRHQLRGADRQPADGAGRPCTCRRSRRSPASSTGLSDTQLRWRPHRLLAGQHRRGHRRRRRQVEFPHRCSPWSRPSTTRTHQMHDSATAGLQQHVPGVDGHSNRPDGPPRTARTTCWRSSRRDRDGLRQHLRRAQHVGAGATSSPCRTLSASTTAATSCTARRGRWPIRVRATSAMAVSTSAPPTRSGSTTTSAAATRSW